MADLSIPDDWSHFISNWDAYRRLFESFCIYDDGQGAFWYKGWGPTRAESLEALKANVAVRKHVGVNKLEPSRYVADKGAFRAATIPPKFELDEVFDL